MKKLITICLVAGMLLANSSVTNAVAVDAGGWAVFKNIRFSWTTSEYQHTLHTHAEAGFDIASGTPVSTDDDYELDDILGLTSYASTSNSWGKGEMDSLLHFECSENYASADSSIPESWGYGSATCKHSFILDASRTIRINYIFEGYIWADSSSANGSAFSTASFSIDVDGVVIYEFEPDAAEVIGVDFAENDFYDEGDIYYAFDAGTLYELTYFVDIYGNAAIPEPATIFLLTLGGVILRKKHR